MKKLNNEDLQNVSAGGDSHDIPMIEQAMVALHEHGGRCKHCGTSVMEFEPFEGPIDCYGIYYTYLFKCKCPLTGNVPVNYHPDTREWTFSSHIVD